MTKTEQRKIAIKAQAKLKKLTALPKEKRCSDTCRGWDVFHQGDGLEIQTCDDCWQNFKGAARLTDDEATCMPEALKALLDEAHEVVRQYNEECGENEPTVLADELSVWQRSFGIPGLPGLTEEERQDLEEELEAAHVYMTKNHPAGVH